MKLIVRDNSIIFKRVIVFTLISVLILISAVVFLAGKLSVFAATTPIAGEVETVSVSGLDVVKTAVSDNGELYVVSLSGNNTLTLTSFDADREKVSDKTIPMCDASQTFSQATALTIDDQGSVYVARNDSTNWAPETDSSPEIPSSSVSCIQKYNSLGQNVPSFAVNTKISGVNSYNIYHYSSLAVSQDGSVFAAGTRYSDYLPRISKFDTTGQLERYIGLDSGPGQFVANDWIVGLGIDDNSLYVTLDYPKEEMYVYDLNGEYERTTPFISSPHSMVIRDDDILGVGDSNAIWVYDLATGAQKTVVIPFEVDTTLKSLSENGNHVVGYRASDHTVLMVKMRGPPVYVPSISVSNITYSNATITIEADPRELITDNLPTYVDYRIRHVTEDYTITTGSAQITAGEPVVLNVGFLVPGKTYSVSASIRSALGSTAVSPTVLFDSPQAPPASITGIEYETSSDGRKVMHVSGDGLGDYANFLTESAISLGDGQTIGFCADGIPGASYDDLVGFYPLIRNSAPCYWVIHDQYTYTQSDFFVWLPDSFDTNAETSVSVNNSPVFTIGGSVNPPEPTPTVESGAGSLENTPTLPVYPTFKGVALPNAQVVVTIHSDPVTCSTVADNDGNWSCTFNTLIPEGLHTVFVQLTNTDSTVVELGPYPIVVDAQTTSEAPSQPADSSDKNPSKPRNNNRVAIITDDDLVVVEDTVTPQADQEGDTAQTTQQPASDEVATSNEQSSSSSTNYWWIWVIGGVLAMIAVIVVTALVRKSKTSA